MLRWSLLAMISMSCCVRSSLLLIPSTSRVMHLSRALLDPVEPSSMQVRLFLNSEPRSLQGSRNNAKHCNWYPPGIMPEHTRLEPGTQEVPRVLAGLCIC